MANRRVLVMNGNRVLETASNHGEWNNHLNPAALGALVAAGLEAEQQGAMAEEQALEASQQYTATVDMATVAQCYQLGLATAVEAKYEQVGRIEDRLESQIKAQESRLQTMAYNQPGFLSRPGARQAWQAQQMQQQQVLQKLHARLEAVREIRASIGVHGPKIEELAQRAFRMREPELAMIWDDIRATERGHETFMRKQEQERRRKQEQDQGIGMRKGPSLTRTIAG